MWGGGYPGAGTCGMCYGVHYAGVPCSGSCAVCCHNLCYNLFPAPPLPSSTHHHPPAAHPRLSPLPPQVRRKAAKAASAAADHDDDDDLDEEVMDHRRGHHGHHHHVSPPPRPSSAADMPLHNNAYMEALGLGALGAAPIGLPAHMLQVRLCLVDQACRACECYWMPLLRCRADAQLT